MLARRQGACPGITEEGKVAHAPTRHRLAAALAGASSSASLAGLDAPASGYHRRVTSGPDASGRASGLAAGAGSGPVADPAMVARAREIKRRESKAFASRTPRSAEWLVQARTRMPDGVPMAWMAALQRHPPVVAVRGAGSRFWEPYSLGVQTRTNWTLRRFPQVSD